MLTLIRRALILAMLASSFSSMAIAQTVTNAPDGVAIKGYDPVAYFEGKAMPGSAEFTYRWNDATWRFASGDNRDRFAVNPSAYAPQYGGYCAYGLAKGYKAPVDPTAWRVIDGKLYLNYSASVQQSWLTDVPGYVKQADANWTKLGAR